MSDKREELELIKAELDLRYEKLRTELLGLQIKERQSIFLKYYWFWWVLAVIAGSLVGASLGDMI